MTKISSILIDSDKCRPTHPFSKTDHFNNREWYFASNICTTIRNNNGKNTYMQNINIKDIILEMFRKSVIIVFFSNAIFSFVFLLCFY